MARSLFLNTPHLSAHTKSFILPKNVSEQFAILQPLKKKSNQSQWKQWVAEVEWEENPFGKDWIVPEKSFSDWQRKMQSENLSPEMMDDGDLLDSGEESEPEAPQFQRKKMKMKRSQHTF